MQATKYNITFGLNDLYSNKEEVDIDTVMLLLENIFKRFEIHFSIYKSCGGYQYQNGKFILENTIVVTTISNTDEGMDYFISELKMLLNQETILLQKKTVELEYL